jgi:hypothetical protein
VQIDSFTWFSSCTRSEVRHGISCGTDTDTTKKLNDLKSYSENTTQAILFTISQVRRCEVWLSCGGGTGSPLVPLGLPTRLIPPPSTPTTRQDQFMTSFEQIDPFDFMSLAGTMG